MYITQCSYQSQRMEHFTGESLTNLLGKDSYTASAYGPLYDELKYRFKLRPLCADDDAKGFLELLSNNNGDDSIGAETFHQYFNIISSIPNIYYPIIVEDLITTRVVGTGILVVEQKFIHQAALRGRMENIFVNKDYLGRGITTLIMETLALFAEKIGCYKINVSCSQDMVECCDKLKLVFEPGQNIMQLKFVTKQCECNSLVNKSML